MLTASRPRRTIGKPSFNFFAQLRGGGKGGKGGGSKVQGGDGGNGQALCMRTKDILFVANLAATIEGGVGGQGGDCGEYAPDGPLPKPWSVETLGTECALDPAISMRLHTLGFKTAAALFEVTDVDLKENWI
ncbi:hypothetical protein B0H16DRAFT_1476018 [Mycena metata]|uniref:Uncharacterized protein n=1 Tax=Mycena metata TaxID=1033252 RepID=A0AAD7HDG4_9AGAR|nr:hypothetical protein B0H16DRAFT_1476018 [Mycena metata]